MNSQSKHTPAYSFEFFPPKTEQGIENLRRTRDELAGLNPRFFSVTFGAGGSTQERTFETVTEIQRAGLEAAPHLSCIGSTRDELGRLLDAYREEGIRHIVALRGDMPSGMQEPGELRHANELVEFIRQRTGDHFYIEVAAYPEFHPQAPDALSDLDNFKRKVDAGANAAITQYFYNADAYFRFVEACDARGIDIAVVPGIMPITNVANLVRFSAACGAEVPRWLHQRLAAFGEDDRESMLAFGIDVVTALCRELLDQGAPGLHFYTMNRSRPTVDIWNNLGLS